MYKEKTKRVIKIIYVDKLQKSPNKVKQVEKYYTLWKKETSKQSKRFVFQTENV